MQKCIEQVGRGFLRSAKRIDARYTKVNFIDSSLTDTDKLDRLAHVSYQTVPTASWPKPHRAVCTAHCSDERKHD